MGKPIKNTTITSSELLTFIGELNYEISRTWLSEVSFSCHHYRTSTWIDIFNLWYNQIATFNSVGN